MASIFTYETEPSKVSSPWPLPPVSAREQSSASTAQLPSKICSLEVPRIDRLGRYDTSKLIPEPQDGPVEYKLHLLLRPRRYYASTTTVEKASGSYLSKPRSSAASSDSNANASMPSSGLAQSNQLRQNRLQHLTTQLLWRLQQSSPNHSATKSDLVLPILPNANFPLQTMNEPGKLVSGLEESRGALYEIGVSDDGTIVGLCLDELEESLEILRAMAHSLGCEPHIVRLIDVGRCHWLEQTRPDAVIPKRDTLWVAEVLVAPCLNRRPDTSTERAIPGSKLGQTAAPETSVIPPGNKRQVEQLRVSLTGSTTSGKTSLLGTLSTATLDNGRGKSRLSLLKHRHEIVSGLTSSLAQELIGYQNSPEASGTGFTATNIVNFGSANISSWADIHNVHEPDRLVFLTDSAGHPKFRRTTVRGLISWAPHWTLCCVAADDDENSSGGIETTAASQARLGTTGSEADLSKAHLELCLKLALPLIIVITKLDLASKNGLRRTLTKVLTIVKDAGRKPLVLAGIRSLSSDSQIVQFTDKESVQTAIDSIRNEGGTMVPIALTSAVTGAGIGQIHALLSELPADAACPFEPVLHHFPMPIRPPSLLYHVDEIFALDKSSSSCATLHENTRPRFVLSGYLRYGAVQIGHELLIGPFGPLSSGETAQNATGQRSKSLPGLGSSLVDGRASTQEIHPMTSQALPISSERHIGQDKGLHGWYVVQVTSLRFLRLPVQQLYEGQVGTVGISTAEDVFLNGEPGLRRGMILSSTSTSGPLPAYTSITALFAEPDVYVNPGSMVTLYTASIRTQARIVEVKVPEDAEADDPVAPSIVALNDKDSREEAMDGTGTDDSISSLKEIEITFRFTNSVEWVELGTKVLVTPASGISMLNPPSNDASGASPTGLDGFVGRIVRGL